MAEVFDYIESQNDADELITEFGRAAVLQAPGTMTIVDGEPVYGEATDHACTIVELDFETRLIDGSLIRYGDKQVLVSPKGLDIVPDPATHTLLIGGVYHSLVPPMLTLAPAGIVVLYTIQARRSGG